MSSVVVVTGPASEPITLAEAKEHLRVTYSDEDAYITTLIAAARAEAEITTGRALITQTLDWFLDHFPTWTLDVPRPPLQSVTTIKYFDSNDVQQTWDSANYVVDANGEPGRIQPVWEQSWPTTRQKLNAIEIRFVAGWTDAASIPDGIKQGMLKHIADQYEQRQSYVMGVSVTRPMGLSPKEIWTPHRRYVNE